MLDSITGKIAFTCLFLMVSSAAVANSSIVYKAPPSTSTRGSVPVISDTAMEACVKLYNEAEWLEQTINSTTVDEYSQQSVDQYNAKVTQHSTMIDHFNKGCAGKQSRSAYEAAKRLNESTSR